jgi:acetate kinase
MQQIHFLTINGGSSSIRFAWYEWTQPLRLHCSGKIARIGHQDASFTLTTSINQKPTTIPVDASNFQEAAKSLLNWLAGQADLHLVKAVGHRVVHGLQHTAPAVIDDALLKDLKKIRAYDPDHLPAEIELIELCRKHYPHLLQVACFDTAFHTTMPPVATRFALPRRFYESGLRRYGFHGLSYAYLLKKLEQEAGPEQANGRVILAHLGSGASITAVQAGKSIDTSMGFTPAGGLPMSSRAGDLDPGVAWYLLEKESMTAAAFNDLINHQSGLLGISETSGDMQDLLQVEAQDARAAEAIAAFCYQVKKYIGAYMAVLGGLDILVFSGGIGENAPVIRERICKGMGYAGITLDPSANEQNRLMVSAANSGVKIYIIPTDEEGMIVTLTADIYHSEQGAHR